MSKRVYLFGAWCAVVFLGSVVASFYAWSPFSDENRRGGGGLYARGPIHK